MLRLIIGFSFFVFAGFVLNGQPLKEPTYEMKLLKAEELTRDGDYYNALDMYQDCYRESKDYFLIRPIAHLSLKLRDYERAEKWYERMVEKPERYYTKLIDTFYYARLLKINQKFPLAKEMYTAYIAFSENDSIVGLAENEMKGMEIAANLEESKDIFAEALPTDVNSPLTEASPKMGVDGYMYFSTFKRKSKIVIDKDAENYHFKIYKSKADNDGKWTRPDRLTTKINREDYHTGNVSFSRDGNTMYFTRSRLSGDSLISSKIYYSTFDGNKWEGARLLPGANGNWIATHPIEGDLFGDPVLYFVSDMPGGYGGFDVYYCTDKGAMEFGTPINLGDVINTKGDDLTPYYVDGTLYFSSDGHPGLGGLDLFSSTWDGSKWSTPANMELPYNSPYDDFYFAWNAEEKKGFLVSNRPYPKKRSSKSETCCDDIFIVAEQEIEINTLVTTYDNENTPLTGSKVIIKEYRRGDVEVINSRESERGNTFNFPLQVDKQYRVVIQHPDYESDSFEINTVGLLEATTFERKFNLTPKPKDEVRIVTINEPIRLSRIYYDFDDDQILPESEPDLNVLKSLMDEYPNMVIELSSHTDSRGNDPYNENLSARRAESAKTWLVERGVAPARIQAVGYGETQILNGCTNGVSCSEDEHRFNRRTEFKIIEGPTTIEIKKEVIVPAGGSGGSGIIDFQSKLIWSREMSSIDNDMKLRAFHARSDLKNAELEIKKKFHDYGIVFAGEKRSHTIKFTNTGTAPLVIERVTGSSCLDLKWPDYPIIPGHDSEIDVEYDSSERKGEDELTIDIIANTKQRVHSTRMRAFVQ